MEIPFRLRLGEPPEPEPGSMVTIITPEGSYRLMVCYTEKLPSGVVRMTLWSGES